MTYKKRELIKAKQDEALVEAKRYEDWAMPKDRNGGYTTWKDASESVRIFTEITTCYSIEELDLIIENLKARSMPYFAEKMAENID